ncbi:Uncharacterised protein [Vibrio vulnificus]|uniref:hypothetical protein n=1 Tax=Vibrio vulnificus TaxID=672 RepID=UPI000735846C|nr:hypothetical protein [Vibrio vulnificus]EHU9451290.1 hypothetical protein [Vibrio vulnificus]EIO3982682.1 hypothetical protein [Vibrio vulnificus]ELF6472301.1 hypothetical protein [Vibrio vulnificus]ELH9431388.1 hypothetical protein [Vibrio vulnificus]PNM99265.1 hypothetical protein AL547_002135 [Vibrio vulnificus]
MVKKINLRRVRTIVGEGPTEKAFLTHLRQFFSNKSIKISIKTAHGKGPCNILGDALGTYRATAKNMEVAALLDLDLEWNKKLVKECQSCNITLVGVDPCIEALMLQILGKPLPIPCTNDSCKKAMHPLLSGSPTKKESYAGLFTQDVVHNALQTSDKLKEIKELFQP